MNVTAALVAGSGATLDDGEWEIEAGDISGTGETAGGEWTGAGADATGGFTLGDGAGDGELTNCEAFDDDFSGDGNGPGEPNGELCAVVNPMKNAANKKQLYLYDDAIAGNILERNKAEEFVRQKELRLAGYL